LIEQEAYKPFYMHKTGHWLGRDVHDAGEYKIAGEAGKLDWRILQAGMTLTVEPGLYIRPSEEVPKAFWNIGIRIEDDVAVTEQGCHVMTAAAAKSIADIEQAMAQGKN
jgi:Xaa-Pro aminopeptidase